VIVTDIAQMKADALKCLHIVKKSDKSFIKPPCDKNLPSWLIRFRHCFERPEEFDIVLEPEKIITETVIIQGEVIERVVPQPKKPRIYTRKELEVMSVPKRSKILQGLDIKESNPNLQIDVIMAKQSKLRS